MIKRDWEDKKVYILDINVFVAKIKMKGPFFKTKLASFNYSLESRIGRRIGRWFKKIQPS